MLDKLKYRLQRQKVNEGSIEDVYDEKIYQEFSKSGAFLSCDMSISLLGNTDGVSLIQSTVHSPPSVYLVINEFSSLDRYENFVIYHPYMHITCKHFRTTHCRHYTRSIHKLFNLLMSA